MEKTFGTTQVWLISDNAGEYTSKVLTDMLGDMDIRSLSTVTHNSEENGIAERFNSMIMNSLRPLGVGRATGS